MRLVAQPDCKSGVSAWQVRSLPLPLSVNEGTMMGTAEDEQARRTEAEAVAAARDKALREALERMEREK